MCNEDFKGYTLKHEAMTVMAVFKGSAPTYALRSLTRSLAIQISCYLLKAS